MLLENKNIINKIYQTQEEELDKIIKIKSKEIENKINKLKIDENVKKENSKMIEQIEEIYNIKIATYIEEFYKQGFIDGVNLMINCLENS